MLLRLGRGLGIACKSLSSPGGGEGGGGEESDYLDSVISSVCCDLDATVAASYGGSGQTWANLIASPADGAGQTDYDFHLGAGSGASTDDPTFTGASGDAGAYFALDGGDYFTSKTVSGTPTLYNMQRKLGGALDTNAWWTAFAYKRGADANQVLWGRGWNSNAYGMYMYSNASNTTLYQDAASLLAFSLSINQATDNTILIVSTDMEGTSDNVRWWYNSPTGTVSSRSWNANNTNPAQPFIIGGTIDSAGGMRSPMANGSRIYHFSCGNELLDDTKAAAIIAHLETRHGRDYTP